MLDLLGFGLVGMNLLAYLMIKMRPKLYKVELYKPMLVNIRLSVAPILVQFPVMFICLQLDQMASNTGNDAYMVAAIVLALLGFCIWLLLLPNSGYLITELNFNHRQQDAHEVPLWYDIISVLTLAMSGVLNMCYGVLMLEFMACLLLVYNGFHGTLALASWVMTVVLLVLASFGIYLGRYIRFNSWDIRHPVQFIKKLAGHYREKGSIKNCGLFVLLHALFFIMFYNATMGASLEQILSNLKLMP